MKRWIVSFLQLVALSAFAAGPPLHEFCAFFQGDGCDVTWAATNPLPATVTIFKVVPSPLSQRSISNLLELAELTERDKKRPVQSGVFAGKGVRAYGNRKETRSLEIVPSEGFVVLVNSDVISGARETSEGVPTMEDALKLTLNLLPRIGIKQSELATNRASKIVPRSFSDESDIYKEKPSGKVVTNVLARWISLSRQIEGIPVWGDAGVTMKFGNHARVSEMNITWRSVEPSKEHSVPSSDDFVTRIKTGKTLVREGESRPFKKLTITNVNLYYWENSGSEAQSFIYPFAVLDAKTDLGGKDSNVQIFVPFTNE